MPSVLAIVTGASSGIGAALTRHAAGCGATVATASRREAAGTPHLRVDLSNPAGWSAFTGWMTEVLNQYPRADVVLFHCAATLDPIGFAGDVDASRYEAAVSLNSTAPQVIGNAYLGGVRHRPGRRILVQISSGAAQSVYPGWSHYGPAKAAVDQWVRTVGREQMLRPDPIQVLSVAPGVVATDMQTEIRAASPDDFPHVARFVDLHARGQLRDPDTVAAELWNVAFRPDLQTGSVVDLRSLG